MAPRLLILSFLTLTIVAALSEAAESYKVCRTDVCKKTSRIFQNAMDPSARPCDNFYKFACGGFVRKAILKPDQNMIGPFYDAFFNQQTGLKNILDQPSSVGATTAVNKAITFYKVCKNSVLTLKQRTGNMNFLKQMLTDFLSGWPLTTRNWNSRGFDLTTALAKIAGQLDSSFFVSPMILPDMANSTKYTVTMVPANPHRGSFPFINYVMKTPDQWRQETNPGLPSKESNYAQQPNMVGMIRQVVCIIDPNCATNPYLYSDIQTLNGLLTQGGGYALNQPYSSLLNKFNLLKNEYSNDEMTVEDIRFTIARLNLVYPLLNWQRYFQILFQNTDIRIDNTFKVLVDPQGIRQMLSAFGQLNNRELALFFGWQLVVKYGKLFSPQLRALLSPTDQSDECLQAVNDLMGYAVAKHYNDKYLSKASINEVETIVGDLKIAFQKLLSENTWMDSATKSLALKKLDYMSDSVAAPQWTNDTAKLDAHYSKLTSMDLLDFPTAFKKAKMLKFSKLTERLKRSVDRENDWPMETPAMTNAMYYVPSNAMYFGSGMLQYPFYQSGLPRAVNFGSFGYVAGHEITHGFDTAGGTRNARGEVENWWSSASYDRFMTRAQCFMDQYGSIQEPMTGMQLNGMSTIGENIADNGGIRAAFRAYKNVSKSEGGRLDGLEQYTEDQLFFMSAAHTYCTKSTPGFMQMTILSDEHSPSMYRALVPLLNSEDFSKAFNCPVYSVMNPPKKCRVW